MAFLDGNTKRNVSKHSHKIEINKGRYGVCKKEFYYFDSVDLYIEMLILLNCELIGQCRTCTNIFRWVIEILQEKWDTIRFINFEKAMEIAKNITLPNSLIVKYYQNKKKNIKLICRKAKVTDEVDVILDNKEFFVKGDNLYKELREFILNIIREGSDFYQVNEFKDDDLFESFVIQ